MDTKYKKNTNTWSFTVSCFIVACSDYASYFLASRYHQDGTGNESEDVERFVVVLVAEDFLGEVGLETKRIGNSSLAISKFRSLHVDKETYGRQLLFGSECLRHGRPVCKPAVLEI